VIWPDLLVIAKNSDAPTANRKDAVFWLSQEAGDAATKGLSELADDENQDREVRDQAVFALSQLPHDQGIPILIRLARTNKDPKVRRKALFWLGQSDDPRALALIEEILTKG
jgi:HEAT repeat protein